MRAPAHPYDAAASLIESPSLIHIIALKLTSLDIFDHGKKGVSLVLRPDTVADSELKAPPLVFALP